MDSLCLKIINVYNKIKVPNKKTRKKKHKRNSSLNLYKKETQSIVEVEEE